MRHARELLGTELAALVGESYDRAYGDMVRVQQLTELEEVIRYSQLDDEYEPAAAELWKELIRETWRARLRGVQRNVEVWQSLLSVRSLVLSPSHDVHTYLKFSSLCRKSNRLRQSRRILEQLLRYNPLTVQSAGIPGFGAGSGNPSVMFGFLKHLWHTGEQEQALARLADLVQEVDSTPSEVHMGPIMPRIEGPAGSKMLGVQSAAGGGYRAPLLARVHLRLGIWTWTYEVKMAKLAADQARITDTQDGFAEAPHHHESHGLQAEVIQEVQHHMRTATDTAPSWAKSWHQWGLFNLTLLAHHSSEGDEVAAVAYVAPAVVGFFRSVALTQAEGGGGTGENLQDILRILTLWFNHGAVPDVEAALQDGFSRVSIDTWLVVIPQMIARIHTAVVPVRKMIHGLLVRIGRHHPQALMYPLLVACKSQSASRRAAAMAVVDYVRQHSATLVQQAQLVSAELIRMAILWHEMWHEALEEASRLYFSDSNVAGMLAVLEPLHDQMAVKGPTTLQEHAFVQAYGRELGEAADWCRKYRTTRKDSDLHQAWDLYYHVFKRINKQLPQLTVLELQNVAPALVRAQGLELAVPGTYIIGEPVVTITAFAGQLHVITSKQRPRKLTIHGSDGAEYMFLLKGHEDLRQDERVMQLFGLVNTMLANDRATAERDLSIARYAVIPLSPNSGLIGWVPNTDTLHTLIREYRDARKVPLNVEHRLMLGLAPDYDMLTVIGKVEVFEHALNTTSGDDLQRVMWLKSRSSEVWLERRTAYTRSTAVMSMVGYLLGLGDRHPSNLMLDRYSGKLLHIDFGDCFEAAMIREKFPEKVPFRLTRMMIKAMEVSGIEGNFRSGCEETMRVLRGNKDSVIAMLEAFVHDPLINWRLINPAETATEMATSSQPGNSTQDANNIRLLGGPAGGEATAGGPGSPMGRPPESEMPLGDVYPSLPHREAREKELLAAYNQLAGEEAKEVLNERAVGVMKRMADKLTGRDFPLDLRNGYDADSINIQVNRLIVNATMSSNLSASYIGWCPFW